MSFLKELFGEPKPLPSPLVHQTTARAFAYREVFIVTSVISICDGPDPIILPAEIDDRTLGETIFGCIKAFRDARKGEQLGTTPREWPAFKASGAKTVRAFEAEVYDVRLEAFNLVVQMAARPYRTLRPHLEMYATANQHDVVQIGTVFKEVVKGAKVLREAGIV